jgi:hypothetical protein
MLAAATTVLGVIPLLNDLFWVSMSVTIMAGLTFGTVLVMILVRVLYAILTGFPTLRAPQRPRPVRLQHRSSSNSGSNEPAAGFTAPRSHGPIPMRLRYLVRAQ